MDKRHISWEEIQELSNKMADMIKQHCANIEQVTLVAVARGGLIPAQLIAYKLGIRDVRVMKLASYFNVGERVFHDKLGVGHITDVIQIGESTMYTIDFGKMGKKAMDAAYAHLKKF
jgi:hypoxanthine phosphoribosyltransferase